MNKRGGNGRRIVDKSKSVEGKPQTAVGIVSTGKTLGRREAGGDIHRW